MQTRVEFAIGSGVKVVRGQWHGNIGYIKDIDIGQHNDVWYVVYFTLGPDKDEWHYVHCTEIKSLGEM